MAEARAFGAIGLLRESGPRWLWLGQLTSSAGDRLFAVALIWIAVELTRSPFVVALVAIANSLPYLVTSMLAGRLLGNRSPLRVARTIDLIRAVLVGALPVCVAIVPLAVVPSLALAVLLSGLEGLFDPALQAGAPSLVARPRAGAMVALLDSTDRIGRILGPALVGLLSLVLPTAQLFAIDAVTFLVSAATLTRLVRRSHRADLAVPARSTSSWRRGVGLIALHPVIGPGVGLRVVCNFAWPAFTVAGPFLARQTASGIAGYGLLTATFGGANLLGNFLVGLLPGGPVAQYRLAWIGAGTSFLLIAIAPNLPLLLAATAFAGACTPVANVTIDALIATELDPDQLLATYGTQRSAVTAAGLLGVPAFGAALAAVGTTAALLLGGAWMLAAVVASAVLARRLEPGREWW